MIATLTEENNPLMRVAILLHNPGLSIETGIKGGQKNSEGFCALRRSKG